MHNQALETMEHEELIQLVLRLTESQKELENKRVIEETISKLMATMRWQKLDTLQSWVKRLLEELVFSLNGLQGCMYMSVDKRIEGKEDAKIKQFETKELHLIGTFAYEKENTANIIPFGDGLTGQAAASAKPYYFANVKDVMQIRCYSGLTTFQAQALIIQPLIFNDNVEGVLEITSLSEFSSKHLEIIKTLSENIAANLMTIRNQEEMKTTLASVQQRGEELLAQEEELRQNMEELESTQEQMKRAQSELNSYIQAVNHAAATVELDITGKILAANEVFLKLLKYDSDLIGKHHSQLVNYEYAQSKDYQDFWAQLNRGVAVEGIFRRIAKDGTERVIKGSYFPMKNNEGKVYKVMKIALDITEFEARSTAFFNKAVDAIFMINQQSIIEMVNPVALKMFGYTEAELVGKNINIIVPHPHHDAHDQYIQNYLQTNQKKIIDTEGRILNGKCKDGSEIEIELKITEIVISGARKFIGFIRKSKQIVASPEVKSKPKV